MVRMLYAACRDVATAVVKGIDVGRWVADDPIITLTNPTRLCVCWGLHRLWTLRCHKAVLRMELDTPAVVMSLGLNHGGTRMVPQYRPGRHGNGGRTAAVNLVLAAATTHAGGGTCSV